jgi:hypothetical protein
MKLFAGPSLHLVEIRINSEAIQRPPDKEKTWL